MSFDTAAFRDWLARYGLAWEGRDPETAALLFAPDALYHWTPFEAPKRGREEIAGAWRSATSRQEGVRFAWEVICATGNRGFAHWRASFRRAGAGHTVRIDGILSAAFGEDGLCTEFHEWWHSDEPPAPRPSPESAAADVGHGRLDRETPC
ncbi:MAG TPA: nuclear transport factor 2 family protein [Longimicrobium sp.]|jgi:nuclear transport factor 2 (NTF2) superfamily protein